MAKKSKRKANHTRVLAHFDATYGRDDTRLEMWQRLCRDIGVEEQPSIAKSKKALKGIYINIVDFVEACEAGTPVRVFHSYQAMRNDLQKDLKGKRERVFPKEEAKGNPILRWMLVKVF